MQKIVFVIESLQCGGAEKSLITLLQNLDFKKFKTDLILFNKGGEFEKFIPNEVTLIYKDYFENISLLYKYFHRIKFWLIKKTPSNKNYHTAQLFFKIFGKLIKIHRQDYDIAIAYNQGFATYYVADKISSSKKFSWLNTDYKNAGYNISFDYSYYKSFNKIVCVSEACESSFQNEAKRINKTLETTIIKDISDELLIKKMCFENKGFSNKKGTTTLLTVGRLAKAKGYQLAINACEILVKKGNKIKWFIIGEGPERVILENLIKDKNLENNIILLGFKENPYPFINTCNIYVQTSLFEGLGLTLIEAAILQKPIVTTNFPTAYGIIENETTGLICEMTPESIATAVERFMNDEILKNQVIENLSKQTNTDKQITLEKIDYLFNN